MWPEETKKISTRLNDKHYGRIMDGFTEEERRLAKKKFDGVSKKGEPGVDTNDYLAHKMPDLLGGIAQILIERELTIEEHRHMLDHGLPLDTWHRGFTKLARCTFTPTDYLTEEDILECRILMCRLAHTNPGKMWDVRKSSMHATVESTAWAGCVRAVGTLYANSPPPAKGSLRDSKITEYTLPRKPNVPQGATPPLVKRSVVMQTPTPLTPAAASPAPAPASVASIPTSAQKPPPSKSAMKTPTHPSATSQVASAVVRVLRRNYHFRGKFRIQTDSAPGQIPALVLMDLLKNLLEMFRYLDSTTVLSPWIATSTKPDLLPDEFPASPLDFREYVDKLYVRSGRFNNWIHMRFRCNAIPDFFTSDYNSLGKPWFDENHSNGYRKVCQTYHDTSLVGWLLMTGPFTNHVFLEQSIKTAMARYLPADQTIEFGCYPTYQKVLRPLDSDLTVKDHPGVAKRDYYGYPAYKPISIECDTEKVWLMQGILRKVFNCQKDPWLRCGKYDTFLLPPPGSAAEGSKGAKDRKKLLKLHMKVVFSLHETKTGIFIELDEPFVFEGKTHTARGVLLSVTWPITEDYELRDEKKPKANLDPVTGKPIKRLYHSVDQIIGSQLDECMVTSYNDRYELAEAFLRVLPKYVARRICQEAADFWFSEGALATAADIRLTTDLEGNWDGGWKTAYDDETEAFLADYASDLSDDEDEAPVRPPDDSTRPPMLATTDDSSVKTFGTTFGRGLEPVAAEEAAALSVDSVSPVELPGAAAPEGGSPSD